MCIFLTFHIAFTVHEYHVRQSSIFSSYLLTILHIYRWVVIPLWLMVDSYGHIASSIRAAQANARTKKN